MDMPPMFTNQQHTNYRRAILDERLPLTFIDLEALC
jgi:hypothetical protein